MKKVSVDLLMLAVMTMSLFSCQSKSHTNSELDQILTKSGDNKKELYNILDHYSENKGDSLKFKAAVFLIKNMDGLATLDTTTITQNNRYFDMLGDLWKIKHKKIEEFEIAKAIDSLNHAIHLAPEIPEVKFVDELRYISAETIINNIDNAFDSWQKQSYSKRINFKEFCEYILPYRCSNTYMTNSREYFIKKYKWVIDSVKNKDNSYQIGKFILNDIDKNFKEAFVTFTKYPYLQPIKFSNLIKGKIGECHDMNSLRVTALRAQGIASALESIPGWGNSNAKHYWYKILDKKYDTSKIVSLNTQVPYSNQDNLKGEFWKDEYVKLYQGTPLNIDVHYCKTVPKVFRECFSRQEGSLPTLKDIQEPIPSYFTNDRLLDVTSEYVKCSDLRIALNGVVKNKVAYLCCFDNTDWTPVDWGKIKNGIVSFKNVGVNIAYLPVYFTNDGLIPAAAPFILKPNGEITELKPSNSDKKSEVFVSKYPYRSNIMYHATSMIGGRFQGANKSDLSDTSTIYKIEKLPFYDCEVKLSSKSKYRYLIYQFNGIPRGHVAEMEFYGINNKNNETKANGTLIGNQGRYGTEINKAFDGNLLSYFVPIDHDKTYIGIDLGQNNEMSINKIRYCPRNDNNAIEVGRHYELSYWKNGWVSIGNKEALNSKHLEFNSVPQHALLLLKDVSGGTENRIFTYDNGKQNFW